MGGFFPLKTEAVGSAEMLIHSTRLHGITYLHRLTYCAYSNTLQINSTVQNANICGAVYKHILASRHHQLVTSI